MLARTRCSSTSQTANSQAVFTIFIYYIVYCEVSLAAAAAAAAACVPNYNINIVADILYPTVRPPDRCLHCTEKYIIGHSSPHITAKFGADKIGCSQITLLNCMLFKFVNDCSNSIPRPITKIHKSTLEP